VYTLLFDALTMTKPRLSPTEVLSQPLTLPCGLVLQNRLVKCPMQETLAQPPYYDPPLNEFKNLYGQWAGSNYGLIITGQVQVDIRCESARSLVN
jgi:2,4-dienoyl-CoA reductase-like NADH-dependent reductase (Old Yellow Enzyme family)